MILSKKSKNKSDEIYICFPIEAEDVNHSKQNSQYLPAYCLTFFALPLKDSFITVFPDTFFMWGVILMILSKKSKNKSDEIYKDIRQRFRRLSVYLRHFAFSNADVS